MGQEEKKSRAHEMASLVYVQCIVDILQQAQVFQLGQLANSAVLARQKNLMGPCMYSCTSLHGIGPPWLQLGSIMSIFTISPGVLSQHYA